MYLNITNTTNIEFLVSRERMLHTGNEKKTGRYKSRIFYLFKLTFRAVYGTYENVG